VRPFAADRDGMATAEGGGLVILEELENARCRGARIYAELIGFGAASDPQPPTQPGKPSADGRGAVLSMRKALCDASVNAPQIDLIASAASGLVYHDAAEGAALQATFGDRLRETPVMNIRSLIGTNGAGSGAIDFLTAVLCIYHGVVPPSRNSKTLDPKMDMLRIPTEKAIDARIEHALSLSYALGGGQNAALVLKRFRNE
jgi:3-oxoacyl-[acyl-carrier-protein] synthase II